MIRAGAPPSGRRAGTHRLRVLAGATSPLAVGEWIADAPGHVLEQVGADADPLLPRRVRPAETTVRRLLARIDGDALDGAVGRWLADRRPKKTGLRGLAVDGKSLRGAAKAKGRKIHLLAALEHATGLRRNAATLAAPSHSSASDDHEPDITRLCRSPGALPSSHVESMSGPSATSAPVTVTAAPSSGASRIPGRRQSQPSLERFSFWRKHSCRRHTIRPAEVDRATGE